MERMHRNPFSYFLEMSSKDYPSSHWNVRAMDIWMFARAGAQIGGELPLTALPRMLNEAMHSCSNNIPVFHWTACGEIHHEAAAMGKIVHVPHLQLALSGTLQLECQRCLATYPHKLSTRTRYRIVETEQQADAAPIDDDTADVIIGTCQFDLLDLMDEELLLSLPLVPKHPVCPALHEALHIKPAQNSPFAALAALEPFYGKLN